MDLSVVIPTYKRPESVTQLLVSIDEQNFDFSKLEVCVVSNFSDPKLKLSIDSASLKNFKPKLVSPEKKGVNASRNYGVKMALGRNILLLDDDCLLKDQSYLQRIMYLHESYKDVCAIGGSYTLVHDATDEEKAYNLISREWQHIHKYGDRTSTRLVGGNVSYKKEILLQAQQEFNEEIEYGGSEAEFHKRLEEEGVKMIFVAELEVYHSSEISKESLIAKARKQALAHKMYSIDGGGDDHQRKTFQSNTGIWALRISKDENQYKNIQLLVELYNRVYHYVVAKPHVSLFRLKWQSYFWLGKKSRQMRLS